METCRDLMKMKVSIQKFIYINIKMGLNKLFLSKNEYIDLNPLPTPFLPFGYNIMI